jgi:hypothetical protein
MNTLYSVDTNVFMDWWIRRYPPDVFPGVLKEMERLVAAGKLFAPERVREEIERYGSRELKNWAKDNKSVFLPHDSDTQTEAMKILYTYEDLIDKTSVEDEADRWVIALAKVKSFTVVTHETAVRRKRRPERKLYIPDVCKQMNIPCIEFIELMRLERWSF